MRLRSIVMVILAAGSLILAATGAFADREGRAIEDFHRFLRDDKARLTDGRAAKAIAEGKASIESFKRLREQSGAAR